MTVKYLAIKKEGAIELIALDDVRYIKGAGVKTEVCLNDGRRELHSKTLESLENTLRDSFIRIHKSYLVRVSEIDKITISPGSMYRAQLKNGEVLPVGRTKYRMLKKAWI